MRDRPGNQGALLQFKEVVGEMHPQPLQPLAWTGSVLRATWSHVFWKLAARSGESSEKEKLSSLRTP